MVASADFFSPIKNYAAEYFGRNRMKHHDTPFSQTPRSPFFRPSVEIHVILWMAL